MRRIVQTHGRVSARKSSVVFYAGVEGVRLCRKEPPQVTQGGLAFIRDSEGYKRELGTVGVGHHPVVKPLRVSGYCIPIELVFDRTTAVTPQCPAMVMVRQ